MDPYTPPEEVEKEPEKDIPELIYKKDVIRCDSCRSKNTKIVEPLYPRLSIVKFWFFGWLYLLWRGAIKGKTLVCNDCGARRNFKSITSWIAIVLFVLLILLIINSK
jgi:DNA-directed RNA polymerase subunit RPC12/RpoP